jgi:hypothetical protein
MDRVTAKLQLVQPWLSSRGPFAQDLIWDMNAQAPSTDTTGVAQRTPSAVKVCALGGGKVQLHWNGTLERRARFVIQRWTAARGWSDIGAVPGHRTSFIDEQLTPYTTCALRVLIEDERGRSNPSNVVRVSVR